MDKSICRRPSYTIFDTKGRLKICRFESESGILRLYFQNRLNHVFYGAHVAEVFSLQFAAGFVFDVVDKVDGVDAVDFQIFVEVGLGFDVIGFDLKQVDQCIGQKGAYFLLCKPACGRTGGKSLFECLQSERRQSRLKIPVLPIKQSNRRIKPVYHNKIKKVV